MNVNKNKVLCCSMNGRGRLNVVLNLEMLEEVQHFK